MTRSVRATSLRDLVAVAEYDNYAAAERAVDWLSDNKFPVEHTTISGVGLRMVEDVLGRLTYLKAAAMGALSGLWIGLLVGVFLALFTMNAVGWFAVILWGLVWGAVAGAVVSLLWHALSGGRRDFISTRQLLADRYEVLVDRAHAERARALLQPGRSTPGEGQPR
ncbi:hypothetical protein EV641_12835 [Rhodococcus sp. SMB37]|uniref:general stress protein n=1 Tax=Rhodococcus sp. SMB37 TaxID=2512213 RepID=UPI00104FCE75|nr:general stress protein [Rhodococcus sp. SMB37]TCN42467.1 hypothetical protein EV641_12835 [Rhodococcus sp. SMB37]